MTHSDFSMLTAAFAYIESNPPIFPVRYPIEDGAYSCVKRACEKVGEHPMTQHGLKDCHSGIQKRCRGARGPNNLEERQQ